ncbi:MAG: hypothetical protein GY925_05875 [Actinomycetia bacterium]|nr:hypothetical protein [Actinomycetes bacterium]
MTTDQSGAATGGSTPSGTVHQAYNFGNGGGNQPSGYDNGHVDYVDSAGWSGNTAGEPPQAFTRDGATTTVAKTGCRVDAYYDTGTSAWVETGFEDLRWRTDIPDGTYDVEVTCGDTSLFGGGKPAYVDVSGNGGTSWTSVFNHTAQSSTISNTVEVTVTSDYLLFRFGQESDNASTDRTALNAIRVLEP